MIDPLLDLVFFFGADELAVVVHHAAESVLLPDLFDLIRQVLDLGTCLIDIASELLSSDILVFQDGSVLLHCLVLTIALSKHVECLSSVSQILQTALDWPVYKSLRLAISPVEATLHSVLLLLISGSLLIELEINSLLLNRLVTSSSHVLGATSTPVTIHHLEKGGLTTSTG